MVCPTTSSVSHMTQTPQRSQEMSTLLTLVKSQYLDARGVGIREFSLMTGIRRTRLSRIFNGTVEATVKEFDHINSAMNKIEEKYLKVKARKDAALQKLQESTIPQQEELVPTETPPVETEELSPTDQENTPENISDLSPRFVAMDSLCVVV